MPSLILPEARTNYINNEPSTKHQLGEVLRRTTNASEEDTKTVRTIRGLVLDCCQQWGIGHGGSALGMAPLTTALWRHILRYDPATPNWADRDRFVLSNGHVGLLQYIMLHLAGYEAWTMEQLKGYGHPTALDFESLTKTHPEIEFDGLDMSTGPLGQGVANAVGMAIANMNLRKTFNRDGFEVVRSRIYCTTGDACLQEGPALEAISLAGRLQLDNLILIYDNNGIQSDGPISLTFDEDVNSKMRACGWYVMEIRDGNSNVTAIRSALEHAQDSVGRPIFINIKTIIGIDTTLAGTCKAHHTAFGEENIESCKKLWGLDATKTHDVPDDIREYWADMPRIGMQIKNDWECLLDKYAEKYPELAEEFRERINEMPSLAWKQALLDFKASAKPLPIRQASAEVYDYLWDTVPFLAGSADLSEPNFTLRVAKTAFGPPNPDNANTSYTGRYIHYGTREHGMMAIANGIAAYQKGTFIPITATFAMFQLYGASAIRMGALSKLQVIHIGTHDSIAEGACGPSHQPVEVINLFRSTPDLLHIRPGDAEEAVGAWMMALGFQGPSVIGLNRHAVPLLSGTSRDKMQHGAYVIHEDAAYKVTLISTGGDLYRAVEAAGLLKESGVSARVVSMPCMRRFEQQDEAYQREILPWDGRPVVSFEAMSTHGWAKYASASIGQLTFGTTVQADAVYPHFKMTSEHIFERVMVYLEDLEGKNAHLVPWKNI